MRGGDSALVGDGDDVRTDGDHELDGGVRGIILERFVEGSAMVIGRVGVGEMLLQIRNAQGSKSSFDNVMRCIVGH